jgi:hypothetical protein
MLRQKLINTRMAAFTRDSGKIIRNTARGHLRGPVATFT